MSDNPKPLVSVIIPCYNRADYIRITLDSVLEQTYQHMELLVVDDGSTDDSLRILESYGDRIQLLRHPGGANKGQSAAINLGLVNARGEYVAILDSDDVFAPTKIEKQVAYLVANPGVGVVYANGMNITGAGAEMYALYEDGPRPEIGPESVLESCAFNLPSNALVRRDVFTRAGFLDESLRSAQDHDMAIRLAEVAPIGYLDEILWYYRRHEASISHGRTIERWRNGFKILDKASRRYPYPLRTRLRRRGVLHFRLGQCLWQEKDYLPAVGHFLMAGLCDPGRGLAVVRGAEAVSTPQS